MTAPNYQIEIYTKAWELIVNDPDFRTLSGVPVGPNNRIRVDQGKVNPVKKTAAQDGDLPELEIRLGEIRDAGDSGTEDNTRPPFAVVQGEDCTAPTVIEYEYQAFLTYPSKNFGDFFPLVEVIRRNLRGYALRRAGLAYAGNTSIVATFDPVATWRDTVRPQHEITITVEVEEN